ncbi:DUF3331 domain-containing protein [Caballeronia sp. LZ001]|uniref:DUF3331 domain-containing protein n=1 Tax=Caballeronia sp. LZ001 TaxID=3038553 RepID=UPI0028596BD9|nr:DUF3331 domain-containing protein [Caballeronia sp. LZ001]MDR5804948.1 DUF3331 domain-containing protein [Caballeronia sp. LZ001]
MDRNTTEGTAWQRAIGQLDAGHVHQLANSVAHSIDSHVSQVSNTNRAIAIALLDRISPRTATVSWSDPQGCKYGEQVWRLATARRTGVCALCGQRITAGDAIYRPAKTKPPPANAAAMMLAIAVDLALAEPCG